MNIYIASELYVALNDERYIHKHAYACVLEFKKKM